MRAVLCVAFAVCALAACQSEPAVAPPLQQIAGREVCDGSNGYAAALGGRRTFVWRASWLKQLKEEIGPDHPSFVHLVAEADAALTRGPYSVTQNDTTPPGGDVHDYLSIATYAWPDPSKPDGLPYIQRDGQFNPEALTNEFDRTPMLSMRKDVTILAVAYYMTGEERYADHAAMLLRTWFLDPATRMNPNMNFSQGYPGKSMGRKSGIIESSALADVVEAIGLLQVSPHLTEGDLAGLRTWFAGMLTWLQTSEFGREEADATNNHGISYDLQVLSFSLFSDQEEIAREVAAAFPKRRIVRQFEPDGTLPRELARPVSFHYHIYTMGLSADVAALAECAGVDLWRFQRQRGGGMQTTLDFLTPYVGRETEWPHEEVSADEVEEWRTYKMEFHYLLSRAARAYTEPVYREKAAIYEQLLPEAGDPLSVTQFCRCT